MRRLLNDFLSRAEARLSVDRPLSWPVELTIEPTNRCNSRCAMCLSYRRDPSLDPPPMGFIKRTTLERLEEPLRCCRKVLLTGCGEPLLHPDFADLAAWVKQRAPYAYIFTNGSLLTAERAGEVVRSGLDLVSISLGGATEKTSGRVRGLPLQAALDGLEELVRARKEAGSATPAVEFNICLMNSILPELPGIVDIARRNGVRAVNLPPLLAHNPGMAEESILTNPDAGRLLEEGRRAAREAGIAFTVWDYPPKPGTCTAVRRGMFVAWNGDVLSCASERHVMGNVNGEPAGRIWRSPAFSALRRMVRTEPEKICPACPVWSGKEEDYLRARPHDRRLAGRFDANGRPQPPGGEE